MFDRGGISVIWDGEFEQVFGFFMCCICQFLSLDRRRERGVIEKILGGAVSPSHSLRSINTCCVLPCNFIYVYVQLDAIRKGVCFANRM